MYKEGQQTDNAEIRASVTQSQHLHSKETKIADTSDGARKQQKTRPWTETQLKNFAIILADEKNEFGYKLDMLALKKTANKGVFVGIKIPLEEHMSSEESEKNLTALKIEVKSFKTSSSESQINGVDIQITSRKVAVSLKIQRTRVVQNHKSHFF